MDPPPFSHKRPHPNSLSFHHPPKPTSSETQFRILCPASKAGGVIGKGGSVIRQLREETGARIRIIDDFHNTHSDERVILISGPTSDEDSLAQSALVRVFERILKVDEERGDTTVHSSMNSGNNGNGNSVNSGSGKSGEEDYVVCRILVGSNQIGCVLGRGGKIIEKIRVDSGAQVRVLPRDSLPSCASPGDELVQMAGKFQAVKKALLLVSSCLQEHHRADTFQGANIPDPFTQRGPHATDHHSRGFTTTLASENYGPNHRMIPEEEVVYRLLCQADKIGSLIGKGGSIVRGIQNETGALIKVNDAIIPDLDERLVIISARESIDLAQSPAQDAVLRVHTRIADICSEPGAPVVARLLVPSQQIGCLLGKGGIIINEMRRTTGANIRIFGREQGSRSSNLNDEIVQVIGNMPSVQDALFQITSRLREVLFPLRQQLSHFSSSHLNTFADLPSPSFRPRHDQASPGRYRSPVGLSHGYENRSVGHVPSHQSAFAHGDRIAGPSSELDHYHYGGDRAPYGQSYEQPLSPKAWPLQAVNGGNFSRFSDVGPTSSGVATSGNQCGPMQMTSVEVVVPQILLPYVYGENKSNLSHITQFSGADVVFHDPNPGATEGRVMISGTPSQLYTAQSLVQAFIVCGQAF